MLNGKQYDAIERMLKGSSMPDIAKAVDVDRTTVYRWLKDEEFMVELEARRADSQDRVTGGFSALLDTFIANIVDLATDKDVAPTIRLQASQYGINMGLTPKKKEDAAVKDKDKQPKHDLFTGLKAVGE
jgi:AcrR family transcriptional regulator